MVMVNKDRNGKKLWCAPVNVFDGNCIWRGCFNAHDCGHNQRAYTDGRWSHNVWVPRGECVTRFSHGCPTEFTWGGCCDKPSFSTKGEAYRRRCRSCGTLVPQLIIDKIGQRGDFKDSRG